ncbi:MAG: hypothetical protein FI709_17385 [SAR202 cluster bacterium]|jgi:hypothetical protein|nr:hypothetical protein [SAR202 cluster bacterium]
MGGTIFKRHISALEPPWWYIISPPFTLESLFREERSDTYMKDGFIGDIGDYSKYGLLRALNQVGGFRLGIVWMKTKPVAVPGRRTVEYLNASVKRSESLSACDTKLYRILRSLVDGDYRTIARLEASNALPASTMYFDKLLDFEGIPAIGNTA